MTNRELAAPFRDLARVMEYLGENPFKTRSYARAYDTIRKAPVELAGAERAQLLAIPGIGAAISDKIIEFAAEGRLATLDKFTAQIPAGVLEMLAVRGLGPKKVRQLVEELHVESVGELLHAIRENRVVTLRGFSVRTQDKLREQLEFYQRSQGQAKYADVERAAAQLVAQLQAAGAKVTFAGEMARQCPVVSRIEILVTGGAGALLDAEAWTPDLDREGLYRSSLADLPAVLREVDPAAFARETVVASLSSGFAAAHPEIEGLDLSRDYPDEAAVFSACGLPFVPAPQREAASPWPPVAADAVVQPGDIRGVVHAHTTWSDGASTIEEMAAAAREAGYEYLTITDHSRAAGYAGGLSENRLREQIAAVRVVDAGLEGFRVFAGTECDILRDGTLDYPDELLAELDVVVASVHSVLRMSESDATERLLRAVANPYVDILGHPTGRLLLSRPGYPLDFDAVLDACAEHGVAIELNASPYRLDLDWTLLQAAVSRGVPVSINPDAHSLAGIHDIRYGVLAAQKAGLRPAECLDSRSATDFADWLSARRRAS